MLYTCVGPVSSFFNTIWVCIVRLSQFLIPVGMDTWPCFCFRFHSDLCTMQESLYLHIIALVWICFKMLLTQIILPVYKASLTLIYLPNIYIWLVQQFWYPQVGSLCQYWCWLLISMQSPIEQTNIAVYLPMINLNQESVSHWIVWW